MTPYERAQQARERAVHTYMAHLDEAIEMGDHWLDVDIAKAHEFYMAGMHALDCAIEAAKGLELTDKEN